MTGDGTPAGTYAYKYYCYPGSGLALGYYRESNYAQIWYPRFQDSNFTCL